jgi:hypothetical protein
MIFSYLRTRTRAPSWGAIERSETGTSLRCLVALREHLGILSEERWYMVSSVGTGQMVDDTKHSISG